MISMWLSLAALVLIALIFMAWPLFLHWRGGETVPAISEDEINYRLAENVRLYREHLAELENNLAMQSIDQTQFAQLKLELERNLLNDEQSLRAILKGGTLSVGIRSIAAFFVVVLVVSFFLYQKYGSASDVIIAAAQEEKLKLDFDDLQQNREPDSARATALIAQLQDRVKARPENLQYWFLMARTAMQLKNYSLAAEAYEKVYEKDTRSSVVNAEFAQAIFLRDGNKMSPRVGELAKSAVVLDSKNTMALGLVGISSFANQNFKDAFVYWTQAAVIVGEESPGGQQLLAGAERAREEFVKAGGKEEELYKQSTHAITFSVRLDPNVKIAPDQIVFIYARAYKGSPMPLAVQRVRVADLPKTVTLDETMAMSPMASLATATEIEIVARISKDGGAQAKIGDWQAKQGPISMSSIPPNLDLTVSSQITADSMTAP